MNNIKDRFEKLREEQEAKERKDRQERDRDLVIRTMLMPGIR